MCKKKWMIFHMIEISKRIGFYKYEEEEYETIRKEIF